MSARLGVAPATGLVLDLGMQASGWLIAQRMAGFMPKRLVRKQLDAGNLRLVPDTPEFPYPAYVCWRRDLDPAVAADLAHSLLTFQVPAPSP